MTMGDQLDQYLMISSLQLNKLNLSMIESIN